MSTTPEELAVIEYLMKTRNLDRAAASNLLYWGLGKNAFTGADAAREEPELKALVVKLKDTLGRGMEPSADSRAARSGLT
jgi:hypothetical protein